MAARDFTEEVKRNIKCLSKDKMLNTLSLQWLSQSLACNYSYNFQSLSRPIIQYPQDMVAMQELIWKVKPDLIIETGIAHGGSLILSASMLALIDYCEASSAGRALDPQKSNRKVLGVDLEIRHQNRLAIEEHPLSTLIEMIEGSSTSESTVKKVYSFAKRYQKIMVILDSNHSHKHVLQELNLFSPLVTKGSYCVVFDTVIEDLPSEQFPDRNWGIGDNPKTAVRQFLRELKINPTNCLKGEKLIFEIDKNILNKIQITTAPDGYLKRI